MAANPFIDPKRPSPSRYEPEASEKDHHAERLCRYQPTIGALAVTADPRERQFEENWQIVLAILEQHTAALTNKEIAEYWQDDESKPGMSTLYNWLNIAAARNFIRKEGRGTLLK